MGRRLKPLRERVAARKAGRSIYEEDGEDQGPPPWRAPLWWAATAIQVVGFAYVAWQALLALEGGAFQMNPTLLILFMGLFVGGRAIHIILGYMDKRS